MGWWKSLPSPVRIRTNVFMSENFSNDTRNSQMRVVCIFFQEHERSLERSSRPVLSRILSALSYLFPTSGNFDFRPGREGIYGCGLGQIVVVSPIRSWLFYTRLLATVTQHHCRGSFTHKTPAEGKEILDKIGKYLLCLQTWASSSRVWGTLRGSLCYRIQAHRHPDLKIDS